MAQFHISPSSALGKELAKHEQHHTKYTSDEAPPGNAYVFRMYPKMLYKASAHPKTGKAFCMDIPPNPMLFATPQEYDRACSANDQLNRSCTRVVGSDSEERNAMNEGWCDSPVSALNAFHARQVSKGNASAERIYSDQFMSPAARAEAAAFDDSTHEHVAEIPAPREKRGRKPNAPMVTVPAMPEHLE